MIRQKKRQKNGMGVVKMANEKRLVNAEAIARKLKYAHCTDCNVVQQIQCSACWVNDVLELLEGDSVDTVEVVHGRWITPFLTPWCFKCSECRTHHDTASNYCPNCGAKMDGDGNG